MNTLISEVEQFLARHELSEGKFGNLVMGDRKFVKQLRAGRDVRQSTTQRVRDFMSSYSRQAA